LKGKLTVLSQLYSQQSVGNLEKIGPNFGSRTRRVPTIISSHWAETVLGVGPFVFARSMICQRIFRPALPHGADELAALADALCSAPVELKETRCSRQ
jgi:hypothetical protein